MNRSLVLLTVALLASSPLLAQTDSGAFVITLGADTIGMERYTRTADRLVDDMVMRDRTPAVTRHFVADIGPDGLVSRMELDNQPVTPTEAAGPLHLVARYSKDEAFLDVTRNGQTTTAHVAALTGVAMLPFINFCYALYDQYGVRARALGAGGSGAGAPVKLSVLNFGGGAPFDLTVTFPQRDSMGVAFENDQPTLFKLNAAGRILGADGRLTTQKVLVTRVATLDLAAFAAAARSRTLGQLSPPDSVRASIGGADIAIDYGRPAMRGRKIFGNIVPWNQVWRTGANFATRLTTSVDLVMGGTTIPKGSYTLWTLPAATGAWKLIINKQTKAPCEGDACALPTRARLWGTDYDADSDFARVDLKVERLPRPVEQLVIAVEPQGKGGLLTVQWETTRASVLIQRK